MAADLQPVAVRAQMIGVMDRPGGEPERAALERFQAGDALGELGGRGAGDGGGFGHGRKYSLAP